MDVSQLHRPCVPKQRVDQIVEKQGAFPLRPIEVRCWAIVMCASSSLQDPEEGAAA